MTTSSLTNPMFSSTLDMGCIEENKLVPLFPWLLDEDCKYVFVPSFQDLYCFFNLVFFFCDLLWWISWPYSFFISLVLPLWPTFLGTDTSWSFSLRHMAYVEWSLNVLDLEVFSSPSSSRISCIEANMIGPSRIQPLLLCEVLSVEPSKSYGEVAGLEVFPLDIYGSSVHRKRSCPMKLLCLGSKIDGWYLWRRWV